MDAQLRRMHDKARGICHLCTKFVLKSDASADHIVPKSQGGSDHPSNLALSHKMCNNLRRSLPVALARELIQSGRLAPKSLITEADRAWLNRTYPRGRSW